MKREPIFFWSCQEITLCVIQVNGYSFGLLFSTLQLWTVNHILPGCAQGHKRSFRILKVCLLYFKIQFCFPCILESCCTDLYYLLKQYKYINCISVILTGVYEFDTSPDGKFIVFLSARSSVDSGVHLATNSLHRIDWPIDGKIDQFLKIFDIVSSSYVTI